MSINGGAHDAGPHFLIWPLATEFQPRILRLPLFIDVDAAVFERIRRDNKIKTAR